MRTRPVHEPGASPVNSCNRHEILGGKARAANKRAIDIFDAHHFLGIARFYRSAIKDPYFVCLPQQLFVDPAR